MRIRNKKVPIIVYSLLLVIILPLTGLSIYFHNLGYGIGKERDRNVNKLFKFEGKLYFYEEGTLVGTYTCKSENCDYAMETMDDSNYNLDYYEDNTIDQIRGLINHRYAFITDNNVSMLYDALDGVVVGEFNAIKNYTIGLANNRFIVMSPDNLWGVIDLNGNFPNLIISYQYNYIGVKKVLDETENTALASNYYLAYDGTNWKIINSSDTIMSVDFSESINSYDDNSIITLTNNIYKIYDYNQRRILDFDYKYAQYVGKLLLLIDFSNKVYLYDKSSGTMLDKGNIMDVSSLEIKEDKDIYYDGELKFSI